MSFKAEIQFTHNGRKVWVSNGMRFATEREAQDFAYWLRPDLPGRATPDDAAPNRTRGAA